MDKEVNIDALFEKTTDYLENKVELIKLQAIDKSTDVVSGFSSKLILSTLIIFFLTLLNIGAALWIGDELGKTYYGFFVMAGFYLLVGLVFYAFRDKWLKEPLSNYMIKNILKN